MNNCSKICEEKFTDEMHFYSEECFYKEVAFSHLSKDYESLFLEENNFLSLILFSDVPVTFQTGKLHRVGAQ